MEDIAMLHLLPRRLVILSLQPLVAALLVVGYAGPTHAVQLVTACGTTCTTACQLANNLTCGGTVTYGVRLTNGVSLDLNGHTITCSNCGSGADAVLVDSASTGSYVTNNGTADAGQILGPWNSAVNCQSVANTLVELIHVDGTYFYGILNCRSVSQNVVLNVAGYGIVNSALGDNDDIRNNLIKGAVKGISVAGSGAGGIVYNTLVAQTTNSIEAVSATNANLEIA